MTITSTNGRKQNYTCGGVADQVALIYAGKIVEAHADRSDLDASVTIFKTASRSAPPRPSRT